MEVPPERIGFSEALSDGLAYWQGFHDCFFFLWLDSGEFESWAKAQLEAPGSPVNEQGLELVSELNDVRRAYYWWFQDAEAEGDQSLSQCPVCQRSLVELRGRMTCEPCSIVTE